MRSISLIVVGAALVAVGILAVLLDTALAASGTTSFTGWSLAPIVLGVVFVWAARFLPPITYPYNPAKAQRMLARARGRTRPGRGTKSTVARADTRSRMSHLKEA